MVQRVYGYPFYAHKNDSLYSPTVSCPQYPHTTTPITHRLYADLYTVLSRKSSDVARYLYPLPTPLTTTTTIYIIRKEQTT